MNQPPPPSSDLLGIAAVERDTGLSKDTLRVWERRYGFPQPLRDANDERVYPLEQVQRLRLLRRLMDQGHRPGKLLARSEAELAALAAAPPASAPAARPQAALAEVEEIADWLGLLRAHRIEALGRAMATSLVRRGLEPFVKGVAAPMCAAVGEAWARGELAVYEEHLFTEQLTHVLRAAIQALAREPAGAVAGPARPRVLLTTFPQEPHALGLLMAEALLSLHGCACVSLGVQTPLSEIARAAAAQQAEVVALSFSACMNRRQVAQGLAELQQRLPAQTEIWVGGGCAALTPRVLGAARRVATLGAIAATVRDWRARHVLAP